MSVRALLDTNILIPLQDSMVVLQPALTNFVRLCNTHGHQLLYHPASVEDIERDANVARRNRTDQQVFEACLRVIASNMGGPR